MTKYYALRWASDFGTEKRPLRIRRGLTSKAPYAPQWHPSLATPPQTERLVRIVCYEDAFVELGGVLVVVGARKNPRHWRNQFAPGGP